MTQMVKDNDTPLVIVKCLVYNQARFIGRMLEGIVSQQTDFPFKALVHDDCSTDNTAEIIADYARRYPDIIVPMYEEENQWSKPGEVLCYKVNDALAQYDAKYMAFCEGDDYWDSPHKLQKQVDYMEAHPDCGMVYSRVRRYDETKGDFRDVWGGPTENFTDLLASSTIPTPGAMVRMDLWRELQEEVDPYGHGWLMGDYPMWLFMAAKSKIHFMEEPLAVYRIQSESACRSRSLRKTYDFRKSFFEISDYMREKYLPSISPEQADRISEAKFHEMLVPAFLLNEKDLIEEARSYFRSHPKGLKQRLVLDFPLIGRPLLRWKYKRDNMTLD